jgi:hypothetical protein
MAPKKSPHSPDASLGPSLTAIAPVPRQLGLDGELAVANLAT